MENALIESHGFGGPECRKGGGRVNRQGGGLDVPNAAAKSSGFAFVLSATKNAEDHKDGLHLGADLVNDDVW